MKDEDLINKIKEFYIPTTKYKIYIEKDLEEDYKKFLKKDFHINGENPPKKFLKERFLSSKEGLEIKRSLFNYYVTQGIGLKYISKYILDKEISYTSLRLLFKLLGIEIRKGRNISTEFTSKLRSEKALDEKKRGVGFFDREKRTRNYGYTERGIQGFYFNESLKKYVWLRSSYEYIFAKWLDKTNHIWDVEVKNFFLENPGEYYRPDFFVYNNEKKLEKIIEIKGEYWKQREYKADLLNEQIKIPVVLITDIKKYISSESNLNKERKKWKKERLKEQELKELE